MRIKRRSIFWRAMAMLLLLLGLTAPAMAVTVYPGNGEMLDPSALAAFHAMVAAGDPGAQVSNLRVFTMTPWLSAAPPGQVVAAMGSDADNFYVAVLKPQGTGWQVVAMANPDNDPVIAPADVSVLEGLSLDVIPYRISKTEIAFGVRVGTDFTSTSTYVASTSLHLFRLHDGQLDDILAADVESSSCDKTTTSTCAPNQHAILKFAASQHGGYYDIILKPVKASAGKAQVYVWNGNAYEASQSN